MKIKKVNELYYDRISDLGSNDPVIDKVYIQGIIDRILKYGKPYQDKINQLNKDFSLEKDDKWTMT